MRIGKYSSMSVLFISIIIIILISILMYFPLFSHEIFTLTAVGGNEPLYDIVTLYSNRVIFTDNVISKAAKLSFSSMMTHQRLARVLLSKRVTISKSTFDEIIQLLHSVENKESHVSLLEASLGWHTVTYSLRYKGNIYYNSIVARDEHIQRIINIVYGFE